MAPGGPSDMDISTLQEFLGIPRAQATILLEKYSNVEQAMNQFLEDPDGAVKKQFPQNQWEPADNIPSFHIDADDTTDLPSMSRPPSRVDNRMGEIGGNRIQAEAGMLSAEEMQDPELQRALEMSKQDLASQETGVVPSEQQFGPANRPYYEANQWAMTTVASSREVVEHPPPARRKRSSGQPAFLRGSSDTGYLAPLLSIYHNIPLAREALLIPSMRVLSYGYDPQWWSGTSDENTKSLSMEASDLGGQDRHNLLAEIQCLMAFLDGTDRAYGSVDALSDLRAVKAYGTDIHLTRLLETWVAAAMTQTPDNQLTQIFTSTAVKAPSIEGYSPMQKDLVCLEPTVRRVEGQTLVNMLDSTIWDDLADKIDDIWIQECAEIFTMRLYDPSNENKGLGLEIPAVWYPDRYMYEYREITRQWRQEMLAIRHEINQCVVAQRRCEVAQGPGKRVIKIRDVLEAASKLSHSDVGTDDMMSESIKESSTSASPDLTTIKPKEIQNQLQAILHRIDEKMKVLEERKVELQQQIKTIASQLTQPIPDNDLSPSHKYYLQGVSTKPNITYIRRSTQHPQTLIDVTTEDTGPEFEWWRMVWGKDERIRAPAASAPAQHESYQSQSTPNATSDESIETDQAYTIHTVSETEVLEAAKTEHNSVLLVYANENAMKFTPNSSSPALRKFVEQDNRAFQAEIRRERMAGSRRYSQDTNSTIMDDIPVNDRSTTPSNMREMTPMSTTSPLRGADGQPSPKRAKGDEAYHVYREVDSEEEPPPYEDNGSKPQMQEKKVNKIGMLADRMLERFGGEGTEKTDTDGPVHIEHAKEPLR